jgi:hypothetical protein
MTILAEGKRIVDAASAQQITLRLMGASAIATHSPHYTYLLKEAGRRLTDLDFMSSSKDFDKTGKLMQSLGYRTMRTGMMLASTSVGERSIFDHPTSHIHVDVFFDKLKMCHTIDFRKRLSADPITISLADILLEKMQIVRINEKDILDTIVLLSEHELGSHDNDMINADYISSLLSGDWGFYYTVTTNLNKIKERLPKYPRLSEEDAKNVSMKIDSLLQTIENKPKSSSWKIRAKIGARKQWYEDVEEIVR